MNINDLKGSSDIYYLGRAMWKKQESATWQKKVKKLAKTTKTHWSGNASNADAFSVSKSYKLFNESTNKVVATITESELKMLKHASVKIRSERDGILDW